MENSVSGVTMQEGSQGSAGSQVVKRRGGRQVLKDNSNYRRNRSSSRARAEKKPSAPTRRRSPQLPFTRKEAFSELEAAPDHPTVSRTKRSRSRSAVESLERPRKKARARRSLTSVATRHSARIEAKKLSLTDKEPSSDLLIRKEPRISFSFSNKELHGGQTSETSSKASSKDSIDERVLENFMELDDFNLLPHTFDPCKFTMTIAPHDMRNVGKVLEAPEYVTDIFHRLFQLETTNRVFNYIDKQQDISANMRTILIDWMVRLQVKLNYHTDALHLAVSIVDRYMSKVQVLQTKLQLLGITALLIATKYEEIYPPLVKDCVYLSDRTFSHQDVLDMEISILDTLDYRISSHPTAYPFLCRFLTLADATSAIGNAAKFYLDRMLQESVFLNYRPSLVALASVMLAVNNKDVRQHDELEQQSAPGLHTLLIEYTGYSTKDVLEVAAIVADKVCEHNVISAGKCLESVVKKYDAVEYDYVSINFPFPSIEDITLAL